jgi:hypothetical protein
MSELYFQILAIAEAGLLVLTLTVVVATTTANSLLFKVQEIILALPYRLLALKCE